MDLLTGNAYDADTRGTGWFLGFSDWTRLPGSDLLHVPQDLPLSGLCCKWYDHPAGQDGGAKPVSEGRTLSLLVTPDSEFRLDFSLSPAFDDEVRTVILRRHGDFAIWGAGLHHRWQCVRRSTILSVRWNGR
ncbi:MAG TPA: hypothetical protein VEA40_22740 [Ramlibacter sp.]|nr:hypothetical protein [Ramlibacter sp.]